jgi:hypothetical protein
VKKVGHGKGSNILKEYDIDVAKIGVKPGKRVAVGLGLESMSAAEGDEPEEKEPFVHYFSEKRFYYKTKENP